MSHDTASLLALTPLDGRYSTSLVGLASCFSEAAFIKYRVATELHYLLFFVEKILQKKIAPAKKKPILQIIQNFDNSALKKVKDWEAKTHHDVKAIEYYLRDQFNHHNIPFQEYLHFGLTSEDVNSIAYALMVQQAIKQEILPALEKLTALLFAKADEYANLPMLARTHGQPAVPTTLGKEFSVFAVRVQKQLRKLQNHKVEAKLNGAVGNFNALDFAFPALDWPKLSTDFLISLNLQPNLFTTQIVPADNQVELFQNLQLINTILIGFNQDIWRYISDEYFVQSKHKDQVGSSTMPHKVNPIQFENSEGNLGLANALFDHFCHKLPISRLQRDLSDSTVKRNIGSALGYSLLGYQSCLKGLHTLQPNVQKMLIDLDDHWEIIAEGVQTILRLSGDTHAYEKLQHLTQGKKLTQTVFHEFIHTVSLDSKTKNQLLQLSPDNYLGLASKLITLARKEWHEK